MTDVKSEQIIKHLSTKWKGRNCPMCGSGNWTVSDKVFELREFHDGNIVLGAGPIIPLIPVTCSSCGNAILINAIVSGSVTPPKNEVAE